MTEEEKRRHRCCFTGQRPQKLNIPQADVRAWLKQEIERAISDGYTTFICGMAMGADIWAGETVVMLKSQHPGIHLIAATPYPGFAAKWNDEWRGRYQALTEQADHRVAVCPHYQPDAFQKRSEWIVDHSSRMIACYNGDAGSTRNAIDYAEQQGLQVIISQIDGDAAQLRRAEQDPFPVNAVRHAIGAGELPEDIRLRALVIMGLALKPDDQQLLQDRYLMLRSLQDMGQERGQTADQVRHAIAKAQSRLVRRYGGFLLGEHQDTGEDILAKAEWLLCRLKA